MHAWESIQKTLEIIEARIHDDISIEELADIAALSLFYYQRLFVRLVKKPVREYIKLRRMARACDELRKTEARILDIALQYGFCNHGAFTTNFKDAYGLTPSQYRRSQILLSHFNKPSLLLNYVLIDEGVPLISNGIVLEINRRKLEKPIEFMGFVRYIRINEHSGGGYKTGIDNPGAVWELFHRSEDIIPRKRGGRCLGVGYKGDSPEGCFSYFAGGEVEAGTVNNRFQNWTLPQRDYIVCGFEAENFEVLVTDAIYKAGRYCRDWCKNHGLICDGFVPELYYGSSPDSTYMEMWYPIITT